MFPVFKPGDHVLVFGWIKYRVGDVIVFRQDRKNFIKRIIKISGELYSVGGDNKTRSAKFGPIDREGILGKVILKY